MPLRGQSINSSTNTHTRADSNPPIFFYPVGKVLVGSHHQGAPGMFMMLVGETRVLGGNQPEHRDNMLTPLRRDPSDHGVKPWTVLLRGLLWQGHLQTYTYYLHLTDIQYATLETNCNIHSCWKPEVTMWRITEIKSVLCVTSLFTKKKKEKKEKEIPVWALQQLTLFYIIGPVMITVFPMIPKCAMCVKSLLTKFGVMIAVWFMVLHRFYRF